VALDLKIESEDAVFVAEINLGTLFQAEAVLLAKSIDSLQL